MYQFHECRAEGCETLIHQSKRLCKECQQKLPAKLKSDLRRLGYGAVEHRIKEIVGLKRLKGIQDMCRTVRTPEIARNSISSSELNGWPEGVAYTVPEPNQPRKPRKSKSKPTTKPTPSLSPPPPYKILLS